MPLGRYTAAGQAEDAGDLRLELGDHPALAVAVDRRVGRDRGEQGIGPLDAVSGEGSSAGVAQGAQVVVHGASVPGGPRTHARLHAGALSPGRPFDRQEWRVRDNVRRG